MFLLGDMLLTINRRAPQLYVMNPGKLHGLDFLLKAHEKRGDKIIVFSDNVYSLGKYAALYNALAISGKVTWRLRGVWCSTVPTSHTHAREHRLAKTRGLHSSTCFATTQSSTYSFCHK